MSCKAMQGSVDSFDQGGQSFSNKKIKGVDMKLTELRIGNLVNYRGEIIEITSLIGKPIGNGAADEFEPIPLTPEVLTEWCGFEKESPYSFTKWVFRVWVDSTNGDWYFEFGKDACIRFDKFYLHKLQNLIYALYSEELEIKIPVKP